MRDQLPPDYKTNPFKYLPPEIVLSDAELKLAEQYENGDFSGGYLSSQIAYFRRARRREDHDRRRAKFHQIKTVTAAEGLTLPSEFITLMETDSYVDRLRHNTIWLQLPDEIVPLPADPSRQMLLFCGEGQGCGYWHLLLSPDGTHCVAYCDEPFGKKGIYPSGYEPDLGDFEVNQCADSFAEWIVAYFAACIQEDRKYEALLAKFPGR